MRAVVDLRWRGRIDEHGPDTPYRRVEHRGQVVHIAVGARGDEFVGDDLVFGHQHVTRIRLRHSKFSPGTPRQLSAGADRAAHRFGDRVERDPEHVVQHERHPLTRTEPTQHLQQRRSDLVIQGDLIGRVQPLGLIERGHFRTNVCGSLVAGPG